MGGRYLFPPLLALQIAVQDAAQAKIGPVAVVPHVMRRAWTSFGVRLPDAFLEQATMAQGVRGKLSALAGLAQDKWLASGANAVAT